MKRSLLLLLVLFFVSGFAAFSQEKDADKPPRGYLAITFGPSVTLGDFSDNSWNNEQAGFAKNGYNYTIMEFGFKFIPNFGLTAAIKGGVIPLDVQALADGYAQENGGQFTVTSTRWGYSGFFVGPFACIPTKYVDIDFRIQTGLMMAVSPEMTVSRASQEAGQLSAPGAAIAFNGGLGARIHITKRFSLVTQAEYHISRPTFEVEYYDTSGNYDYATIQQQFSMFNFSFGAAFRIF